MTTSTQYRGYKVTTSKPDMQGEATLHYGSDEVTRTPNAVQAFRVIDDWHNAR